MNLPNELEAAFRVAAEIDQARALIQEHRICRPYRQIEID